jgi:hypothetical protein
VTKRVPKTGVVTKYLMAEREDSYAITQSLRGSDAVAGLLPPSPETSPRRTPTKTHTVVQAHRNLDTIDAIGEVLFSILFAESDRLLQEAREQPEGIGSEGHVRLQRSIDGYVKLSRLALDRDKAEQAQLEVKTEEELREDLQAALDKLTPKPWK